jgi:hypothetical protein
MSYRGPATRRSSQYADCVADKPNVIEPVRGFLQEPVTAPGAAR